jgi:tetratricopeptide (TPR) repeat protein
MRQRGIALALIWLALAAALAAQQAAQKQPQPKSQKEAEAIMAIFNAPTPDARIEAAESLVKNFADTEFKAAASAQEKNDFEKMVIYAERTLEVDAKNYAAMLMLASGIAQRTREFDLDKEEKLGKAEGYAKNAMAILKDAPKPRPDLTDEQWDGAKKDFYSQAHEAMALSAMARKKYDVAITEFKAAITVASSQDPATQVRLGAAYNLAGKHDEAIALLDQLMSDAQLHPAIRQFAQQEKMKALQGKGAAAPK